MIGAFMVSNRCICRILLSLEAQGLITEALEGDLPNSGIKLRAPALQADSLPIELSGKPRLELRSVNNCKCTKFVSGISQKYSYFYLSPVGAQYATGDQWRNNSRKNEGT